MINLFISFFNKYDAPIYFMLDPWLKLIENFNINNVFVLVKLLKLGQDRLGWKSVELCLKYMFSSMLNVNCLTH